jgi:hypothetical protein
VNGTPCRPARSKSHGLGARLGEADDYVGKLLYVRAGESLSLQYHELKDESWLVQEGRAELELGDVGGELETIEIARATPTTSGRAPCTASLRSRTRSWSKSRRRT